jgi:hypothetical protein
VPWLIKIVTPIFDALAKDTCDIGVYLAAAKEIEQVSAVFFDDKKKIVPIYEKYDEAVGRKLWRASEELTSISAAQP